MKNDKLFEQYQRYISAHWDAWNIVTAMSKAVEVSSKDVRKEATNILIRKINELDLKIKQESDKFLEIVKETEG